MKKCFTDAVRQSSLALCTGNENAGRTLSNISVSFKMPYMIHKVAKRCADRQV
jgi:hypothetical protein